MRHLILFAALSGLLAAGAREQPLDEYQVKAIFLFNFAKFVEWPADAFQNPNEPIAICVMGQDPFGHELDNVVKGKAIVGHPLITRRIADLKHVAGCRIIFAATPERKRLSPLFAGLREKGILTVGEVDESISTGAIVSFTVENGKVRFEVDAEAAEREQVRLSSKLLSLARNIKK